MAMNGFNEMVPIIQKSKIRDQVQTVSDLCRFSDEKIVKWLSSIDGIGSNTAPD